MTKKTTFYSLFFVMAILMGGCRNGSDFKTPENYRAESVTGRYQIAVPDFMESTNGLYPDASLQFQNLEKEAYIATIDEPKKKFVDAYKKNGNYDENKSPVENYQIIQMGYLTEVMTLQSKGEPKNLTINGMPAVQMEMIGWVKGIDYRIYYLMTFIEGSDDLYLMLEWTLDDRETEHKAMFETIAQSFKEL
ncbi:MAG TPA: hypothetical protein PKW08_04005 [Flavobacteriaceae bacterium]|nr:hypothetical protein [Flavobacteriaceae bacterium]MCB9213392.1 hypothetical protein [Alteromonas sp.]HPF10284.1 hypothetical protein [Flavobacteriaceae bacterium]HQU20730.1 hypothetical protein [Flavobacteriaceae bacterium]HQU64852.1 hypothetical protein [Flavobacteriaceae bacterium]